MPGTTHDEDVRFMRSALRLAKRGYGLTSPNPMVGAVLVQGDRIIGKGWHRRAGGPHAEIEALHDARRRSSVNGATLYVTLEPCSTQGRTPPCTAAIIAAGIRRVVIGATDPNPRHAGRAFQSLRRAGIQVVTGVFEEACRKLNAAFNHWILHHRPFVTVKAAMTLDGKIATATGESKWITGETARNHSMNLRMGSDAILVGVNTVLADNPSLTVRLMAGEGDGIVAKNIRRIILDAHARTPADARVVSDEHAALTTVVTSSLAPKSRVNALSRRAQVIIAPLVNPRRADHSFASLDLRWLVNRLGAEEVTSLLVEGGGEVNASFLLGRLSNRIAFYFAPKIIGGRQARTPVAGLGASAFYEALKLRHLDWQRMGDGWLLTAATGD